MDCHRLADRDQAAVGSEVADRPAEARGVEVSAWVDQEARPDYKNGLT